MTATNSAKSYYILYGLAEGKFHSRKLENKLRELGWAGASTPEKADVVIGHSGGCLLTSSSNSVLINPTGWPGRPFSAKFLDKLVKDAKARKQEGNISEFNLKLLYNLWYLVKQLPYNLKMLGPYWLANKSSFVSGVNCTIIRNENDSWCTPALASRYPNGHIYTLPGEHDDCWSNPGPYLEIIQRIANG